MEVTEELSLDSDDVGELEEKRLAMLSDAGIDEREVLDQAREDFTLWDAYFNENVTRGKDDMNFVLRDQWTAVERSEFNRLFKPAMTFNKLYDTTKKIVGEQRKNKPDLLVRSLTGKATQEQIDLRSDLVRTISYQSQNDLVYQNAFKSALMRGYGAFEIGVDYETPRSFNQIIQFRLIPDCTHTSFDPTAIKPHKGDGNFYSRRYVLTHDEFIATYPHIQNPVSYSDPRSLLDFQWQTRDTIVIADYFKKEWYPVKILQLSDGRVVTEDEWEDMQEDIKRRKELAAQSLVVGKIILDDIPEIRMERMTKDYRLMHYRMTNNQVIEFSEWPSKYLPGIFVDGDSNFIDGQQYTRSFIHEAKDAQKFLNYTNSEVAAEIKNRRREQWIGTPDNILGYEQMWRNPELQNGILIAKPDPKTGAMPQKMQAWELSQSLLLHSQRASQDIREILGFSETEQLQGRDMSGKARRERKLEGSMSAYVFFDNLNQAIEQAGRVVLDLLPYVYAEDERTVVLSKQDGTTKNVTLNEKQEDGSKLNEIVAGDYDIEIDTGPSFAVQKEMAVEFLQETVAANPQVFNLVADIWAKQLDVQFRSQLVERLSNMVPPEILAKEKGEPPPPKQPNPEEMMMQQQMQMQEQQMHINEQKMQIEEQQIMERAEELKIRKEKHELEKAELMLKAQKMIEDSKMNKHDKAIEMHKADMDYSAKLMKVVADLHKDQNKPKKE